MSHNLLVLNLQFIDSIYLTSLTKLVYRICHGKTILIATGLQYRIAQLTDGNPIWIDLDLLGGIATSRVTVWRLAAEINRPSTAARRSSALLAIDWVDLRTL